MLKKVVCACCAALVFLALACPVRAEVARFVAEDKNASYHAAHLLLHAGTTDCRATGIRLRLRVRSTPGGNDTIGHLEQADQFLLLEVQDNWARVSVTRPGPLSTDSWQGLSGWVSADYIECPCGREAYYANEPESAKWGRAVRNVSMREVASWESAEMYRLKAGELVQILGSYRDEDRNSWIRVAYEDGKTGFVPTEAVGQVAQGEWPEIAGQRTRVWFAVLSAYAREILAYEASTGESAAVSSAALADMDLDGLTDLLFLMKNAKGEQELRMYSFEQGRVERMLTAPWTWNTEGTSIAFHSLNSARCYVENTSRDMSYRGLSAYEQDAEGGRVAADAHLQRPPECGRKGKLLCGRQAGYRGGLQRYPLHHPGRGAGDPVQRHCGRHHAGRQAAGRNVPVSCGIPPERRKASADPGTHSRADAGTYCQTGGHRCALKLPGEENHAEE